MSPQDERSLELLVELLEPGPLTAAEIDGEVRHRWTSGTWPCDQYTRPLTVPSANQQAGHGYGRLYELLAALEAAGRAGAFTDPDDPPGALWSLTRTAEAA